MHSERETRSKSYDIMKSKNDGPLVSVIVPTYKRPEKLIRCLESVFKSTYKNMEIIVINDDPKNNLRPIIKKFKIRLIQHKKERYWVRSRNEGAKLANGRLLFFIDDDNIIKIDTIKKLVKKYTNSENIGVLGPLMLNKDKSLWFYGAKANWINPYPKPVNVSELKMDLIETDVIPNAYMISKLLYFSVGMEDPKFLHHEEFDLAQRLKRKGFKNYIYTKAITVHDHGGVATHINPFRLRIIIEGHIMIERRYAPKSKLFLFLLFFLPINTLYYFFYKIPFKLSGSKINYYKAYINALNSLKR